MTGFLALLLLLQVWVEGESPHAQKGSDGEDRKVWACGLKVLGRGWGAKPDHWAEYRFTLKKPIADAAVHIRYARGSKGTATFDTKLNGEDGGRVAFATTGGWGYWWEHYRGLTIPVGDLKAGEHRWTLLSSGEGGNLNVDGFLVAARRDVPAINRKFWETKLPGNLPKIAGREIQIKKVPFEPEKTIPDLMDWPAQIPVLLGDKPSPYLVRSYDTGHGTDFHHDVVWHLLQKETDLRFRIPDRGKVGVIDFVSDFSFYLDIEAPQHRTHLIDGFVTSGEKADVAIVPTRSDTILFVVRAKKDVSLKFTAKKRPVHLYPDQHFGYGISTTTGKLRWYGYDEGTGTVQMCLDDWDTKNIMLPGAMFCTVVGNVVPEKHSVKEYLAELHYKLKKGDLLAIATNLRRASDKPHVRLNGMRPFAVEKTEEAMAQSYVRARESMGDDWPSILEESAKRYARMPKVDLPQKSWNTNFVSCLELPFAETYSPTGMMKEPWYVFCRPHGVEVYQWWSYGMHAHENLATFFLNYVRPELSQSWLQGHMDLQSADGEFAYGVHPGGRRREPAYNAATAPFIPWEAWIAYLWKPDLGFLEKAYRTSRLNHYWWTSSGRTRSRIPLQHWLNFMETVRDDLDLATWTATNGAENQEALDLNCFLLIQERALERMAEALGKEKDVKKYADLAKNRIALMRKYMWNEEEGTYYGVDLEGGEKHVKVHDITAFYPLLAGLATTEQAARIVKLLHDPKKSGTAFGPPTLGTQEQGYGPTAHWKGANWVEISFLVMQGLRSYGYYSEAAQLAERNCRMVFDELEKTGHFREYYSAETGKGVGLTDYVWTAIPASMIVEVFFGVRATRDGVVILPALPEGWDKIEMTNLTVRNGTFSIRVTRGEVAKTVVRMDGREIEVLGNRGCQFSWEQVKGAHKLEIIHPKILADQPRAPEWPSVVD